MSYIERGLYRELLDECWCEGSIPDDVEQLADICGCPPEVMASAWQKLSKCFVFVDGAWVNGKLNSLRTASDLARIARASSGKKGGLARSKASNDADLQANAKQELSTCHIAEHKQNRAEQEQGALVPEQHEIQRHVQIAKLLRSKGMTRIQSGNPVLLEWAKHGYTDDEIVAAADDLIGRGKNPGTITPAYLSAVIVGNRESASRVGTAKPAQPAIAPAVWGTPFPRSVK